ncbi:MAG: hypothetical protein AB7S41_05035 [Parvibaculaceae bacterium]
MPVKMHFINYAQIEWSGIWDMEAEESLKTVKQAPAKTMKANGQETLWIDQEKLSWWTAGNYNCSCMWQATDGSNDVFGTSVHVPLRWTWFGAAPYWGFGIQNAQRAWGWTDPAPDQGAPLTLKTPSGFEIRITPTCSSTEVDLEVTISKLLPGH